jgi:hypothetical protein
MIEIAREGAAGQPPGRVLSPGHTGTIGETSCVSARPSGCEGWSAPPLARDRAATSHNSRIPEPLAMHRLASHGRNHKVSLRPRVQSWESLGSGRAAVEPPYYRTPTPLIGVKTGTSFVRGGKSESLKT